MPAQFQVDVQAAFHELEAPLVEPGALGLRVRTGDRRQRLTVPEAQRLVDQHACLLAVPRRPLLLGGGGQLLSHRQVQRVGSGAQGIAAGLADQDTGEDLAQAGGVRPDGGERLRGADSPQIASISSPAVAVRPSRRSRAASSARCWGEPEGSGSPPRQARTGPSTPKRSSVSGVGAGAAGARCSGTRGPLSRSIASPAPELPVSPPTVCLVRSGGVSLGRGSAQALDTVKDATPLGKSRSGQPIGHICAPASVRAVRAPLSAPANAPVTEAGKS